MSGWWFQPHPSEKYDDDSQLYGKMNFMFQSPPTSTIDIYRYQICVNPQPGLDIIDGPKDV